MSPGKCASHKNRDGRPGPASGRALLGLVLLCMLARPAPAAETVIATLVVNQQSKGEYFVILENDGDFLVSRTDLQAVGFAAPRGKRSIIEGKEYLSLRSMEQVTFVFDERTLTLAISAHPTLLPPSSIDLRPRRPTGIRYTRDNSLFLNYGVSYGDSTAGDYGTLTAANQLGIRSGDVLFLSDSVYTRTAEERTLVRLMSSFIYDRRDRLERYTAGDLLASSGGLGSTVNMGGLSYAKVYGIDPYFITYPTLDFSGLAPLPSTVEIYMNGMLYRTEQVAPGPFDLRNITAAGGGNLLDVVIRDPFGNETRIQNPFYSSETVLAKGLHQYSYNAGFLREEYGEQSNQYGDPAYSLNHRYGLRNDTTIGFRAEGATGLNNFGPELTYVLHRGGAVNLSLAESVHHGTGAYAGMAGYQYASRAFSARVFLRGQSREYETVASLAADEQVRMTTGGAVGFGAGTLGSVTFEYSRQDDYDDGRQQAGGVSYARALGRDFQLTLSARSVRNERRNREFYAAITYNPRTQTAVSARHLHSTDRDSDTLEVQQSAPLGEGFGYRASVDRTVTDLDRTTSFSPSVQYNSPAAIFRGDYRVEQSGTGTIQSYNLSLSGAIVAVGGRVGLSRPVTDSFALVQVGELEGVRVSANGQEIGSTDSDGKLFVPSLGSYVDNRITINDDDVPVNYSLTGVSRLVSPPLRSGSCVVFPALRVQPVTGKIRVEVGGAAMPVEFTRVSLADGERSYSFITARDGEFYLERLESRDAPDAAGGNGDGCAAGSAPASLAGTYRAGFEFLGKQCSFMLVFPRSEEMIIDLGDLTACRFEGAPAQVDRKRQGR